MNPKLGLTLHMVFFPLASGLFLFIKWFPVITTKIGSITNTIYTVTGGYLFALIIYFALQLMVFVGEKDSEETKKTSQVADQPVTWRD